MRMRVLPFWTRRLEDQAHYVGTTAPLKHKIGEYITSGRFFASLEMYEGEDMIKMVTDFLGDGILMYASDYPHPECRFPDSVDHFLGWESLTGDQNGRCSGKPGALLRRALRAVEAMRLKPFQMSAPSL